MRMETENYVYKKEIDWSTLMEGFTLPLDNQIIFLRNMENFLQRGESKIIHFFMNGKTYDAKIVNVNNSVEKRKKDAYQIRYTRNRKLAQTLQQYFFKSMSYIKTIRESGDPKDRSYIKVPEGLKELCAKVSIDTSSIQYENDDLMREVRQSDDYGIACCVSYQEIGKQIQFFGARCNLAKALLLAINGGRCENTGTVMVKNIPVLTSDTLNFEEVMSNYKKVLTEIARVYNEAMNIIHYMHDKYYYEKAQMALVDTNPRINLAYGVAGLSIALDSLSAIKYAKVTARRNDIGLTEGFDIQGEFPCFGNDNDKVDHLGVDLVYFFSEELKKLPVYKNARPTLSLLTITSNVMYGKKTGATPDGRAKGVAFAPGANPMHGRDKNGAIASLSSVAKLRYRDSQDGISNTFSIVPKSLGATEEDRVENLVTMMDGYFTKGAHHLNVNVLNREMLYDAMEHPEKYPQLTIRVSGYAVNFVKLSREHQLEVISRSFHERM